MKNKILSYDGKACIGSNLIGVNLTSCQRKEEHLI